MNAFHFRMSLLLSAALLAVALTTAALSIPGGTQTASSAFPLQTGTEPESAYVLRERDGEICIYRGDLLISRTGYSVSMLPDEDRTLLEEGIAASSRQALTSLLEDLCS